MQIKIIFIICLVTVLSLKPSFAEVQDYQSQATIEKTEDMIRIQSQRSIKSNQHSEILSGKYLMERFKAYMETTKRFIKSFAARNKTSQQNSAYLNDQSKRRAEDLMRHQQMEQKQKMADQRRKMDELRAQNRAFQQNTRSQNLR